MYAKGRENVRVFRCQVSYLLPVTRVYSGEYETGETGGSGILQYTWQMRSQRFKIEMTVSVNHAFAACPLANAAFWDTLPSMNAIAPEISIIVPILNETKELPGLLQSLAAQKGVRLELILCDGGSDDGSQQAVLDAVAISPFPLRLIETERGRGHQMNAGAALATSDLLLFLHADSRFAEYDAICRAVTFHHQTRASGAPFFAARFALKFRRSGHHPARAWFYFEAKARLPRVDCIRGDQGFLLNRPLFARAGGFDETLPFLEDLRLVAATAPQVEWLLLPAVISTSPRRFEREGLRERQILNAIMVNALVTGWAELFHTLPGLYRCHAETGRLLLRPLLADIKKLLAGYDSEWQRAFWQGTGHHVATNAWQIFFWLDVRRAFYCGRGDNPVEPLWLAFYNRRLQRYCKGRLAASLAEYGVKLWLRLMLIRETS